MKMRGIVLEKDDPDGPRCSDLSMANAILDMIDVIRRRRTVRQREIVRLRNESDSQKAVARALGVSPSVVCEALASARWKVVERALDAYEELVGEMEAKA